MNAEANIGVITNAFRFAVRWANALLVVLNLVDFVRRTCAANYVLAAKSFPASIVSVESLLVVASLTAFFASGRRDDVLKRALAKTANVTALILGLVWLVRIWSNGGFENVPVGSICAWLAMTIGVPVINTIFFWHPPFEPAVSLPEAEASAEPVLQEARNFFLSHWCGRLPLGVSFWVNGWLAIASILAFQKILDGNSAIRNPRAAALLYALTAVIAVGLGIWACVGSWRAASRHIRGGRKPLWGALAKMVILLFVLNQIGPLIWIYFPKARENFNYVSGTDPVEPYQIQVSANGEVIELRGGLRFGSANALQEVLNDLPAAKVLKIDSPGGRVGEALKMMGMIHERGLNTYASQRCMSAATLVLTAGTARGAEQGTRIGFHACRNPSGDATMGDGSVMGGMVAAGIAEAFVHQVLAVPPDKMWFPSPGEMLEAGVLTSYGVFPPDKTGRGDSP